MDLRESVAPAAGRHPWETTRADFFIDLLGARGLAGADARILDIGSGDAYVAQRLMEHRPAPHLLACWDANYRAEHLARLRACAPPGLIFATDRPCGQFTLLLLLDVLEHVEDDGGLLRSLVAESLAPGGHVLVSVPAWQWLFSAHDTALGHHRRYSPSRARALVAESGLERLEGGGLFHSLLPVRAAQQAMAALGLSRTISHAGQWSGGPMLTGLLETAFGAEQIATRFFCRLGVELPGLSWWALCRKRP